MYSVAQIWPDETHRDVKTVSVQFEGGIAVEVMNLGGVIRSLEVPDRSGNRESIVLRYPTLNRYFQDRSYVGCIVGRYANRICKGAFVLNDEVFQLPRNDGDHHLHGGQSGFNTQLWELGEIKELNDKVVINLYYTSPDGEEGYPGKLVVHVSYIVCSSSLKIRYQSRAYEDTIFNPTNHSYFNLSGNQASTINDHWLKIDASRTISVDPDLIPDGKLCAVKGSSNDFLKGKLIGENVYDVCYELEQTAILKHPPSGRVMEVSTSMPGMQLYTGDHLSGDLMSRSGLCLETQFFPDSPNHPHFPSTILRKGESFSHRTTYCFSTE